MPLTFIAELDTLTVHNPYAVAMPTQQIMKPHGWDAAAHGGAHLTLVQVPYDRPHGLPRSVMYGLSCVENLVMLSRLRLGGICNGLRPSDIANVIYELTGVVVAGVDIFTGNKGCCSVWVRAEDEAGVIRTAMHHRVWMAPLATGFALQAKNELGATFLQDEVHRALRRQGELTRPARYFPRGLVTVERYVVYKH